MNNEELIRGLVWFVFSLKNEKFMVQVSSIARLTYLSCHLLVIGNVPNSKIVASNVEV